MTSNNTASNVIPMRDFDRSSSTQQSLQFERLLKECQDVAVERLGKSVAHMLDKAGDALWGLAETATERELRDLYLDAKDKLAAQRRVLEDHFHDDYLAEFERRVRRDGKAHDAFSQYDLSSLELGLVADDDLEETLKVNDMAAKLRRYCAEELAALDQRVGVLVGDATLQGEGNPFSPQAICGAFKHACRHVESNLRLRVVFHKLFDDHVLDDIRSIYKDLNGLLVQRSILPKIRYGIARRPGAIAAHAAQAAAASELADLAPAALEARADAAAAGDQDFFAVLQNLMAMSGGATFGPRGATAGIAAPMPSAMALGLPHAAAAHIAGFPPILGAGPAAAGVALLQGQELLGSLTRIQHGDVSVVAGGDLPLAAMLVQPGTTNVLRELKGTSLGTGMGQMDAMTLDIVAMLFDQIFGDARTPVAMRGLIGRLQIPMLKVAIADKSFFSKKAHPARKFLDSLGEIALGLPGEFDHGSPLYRQLEALLQKLVDGFQEDMAIFDELRTELERVIAEDSRRAEEEAARVAKRIEEKEKLELAKALAQSEIQRRAESRKIPRAVLNFLAEHWVKLLLVAHAKHGPDSELWKTAVSTMDLLIWSVIPKQSLEERRQLASRLPGLLRRLNAGMQMMGMDADPRRQFFAKLMRCHTKVINGIEGPPRSANAPPATAGDATPQPPTLTEVAGSLDFTHMAARAAAANASAPAAAAPVAGETRALGPAPAASAPDEDTEPAVAPPSFSAVVIQNPFGEGEIEVEEISLSDLPGASAGAPAPEAANNHDDYSRTASSLKEGAWVEFRDDEDNRRPARLSYISPLKGTYLFVNRQGLRFREYSLYQLTREFRSGRAVTIDAVPLFDRAMTSLVGVLKSSGLKA